MTTRRPRARAPRRSAAACVSLAVLALFGVRAGPAVALAGCSCAEVGTFFELDGGLAAEVADVTVAGPACSGDDVSCTASTAEGCVKFWVNPHAAGGCHVAIAFADGTAFERDVVYEDEDGCMCAGLYPTDPTASEVVVTPDAGDS